MSLFNATAGFSEKFYFYSALIMESNFVDLVEKSKDEFYNVRTILLLLPVSVISWVEVFGCENYLRPIGGHAVYDLVIPVTSLIYFGILMRESNDVKKNV